MLWASPDSDLRQLSKYDRIVVILFRQVVARAGLTALPPACELVFDQDDVRQAMKLAVQTGLIDKDVDNVADIKYSYDARRELPSELTQNGPITWLQAGKGRYKFRRTIRKNIIDLPGGLPSEPALETVTDMTPPFVASMLGSDEQAVFTRVRNVGLVSTVIGHQVHPIQGHHRTTVSYGQVEVDEVHAGLDLAGRGVIVPISGKGGQDKLSWSQALNLNTYAAEKAPVAGLQVKSIGLWRDSSNTIWIVEFSSHTEIDSIQIVKARRFKIQAQLPAAPQSQTASAL